MSANLYTAASKELAQIKINYPKLKIQAQATEVNRVLTSVKKDFDAIQSLSNTDKINGCYRILDNCADFEPAIAFLKTPHVLIPQNVKATENASADKATINWRQSPERGIVYVVRRKIGKDLPQDAYDGELLKDDIESSSFVDNNPPIGKEFSYSVCAKRKYGNVEKLSDPSTVTKILLPKAVNINTKQTGNTIHITWDAPAECIGATVSRTGKITPIAENAPGYFTDKNLTLGKTYEYTIRLNYQNKKQSDEVKTKPITIREDVVPFDIAIRRLTGYNYRVSWKISSKNANVQILVNGRKANEVSSDLGGCDIALSANSEFEIKALASSGNGWIKSRNIERINTIPLQVYVEWRFLRTPFAKTKTIRVTMDSSKEKRVMTRTVPMVLCAYAKTVKVLPSANHKNAIKVKEIPEKSIATPSCSHSFDFEIDPTDSRFEGKSLKEWNFSLFCLDDYYTCNHPVQRT
jgi:hypothetical protein